LRIAWILDLPEGRRFLWSIYKNENLNYYSIPSVYLIVEFMYNSYKTILLKWLMPAFIIQATFFQAAVYTLEYYTTSLIEKRTILNDVVTIQGNEESRKYKIAGSILLVLAWAFGLPLFYSYYLLFKNMGKQYFNSFYNIIDVVYIILYFTVTIMIAIELASDSGPIEWEVFKSTTKSIRCIEAVLIFLIYVKASYFMSLIDATAPLIDMISEVIFDIRYFIFVMIVQVFAIASSFYIIG
jgi:hypothetical protein